VFRSAPTPTEGDKHLQGARQTGGAAIQYNLEPGVLNEEWLEVRIQRREVQEREPRDGLENPGIEPGPGTRSTVERWSPETDTRCGPWLLV